MLKSGDTTPDHSSYCRFRNQLVKLNIESQLFNELGSQIEKLGLVIKQGTLIDASIVQADVKQPKPNDQGKGGKSAHDPDASWTKKYDKSYFGYKMHIGVDQLGQKGSKTTQSLSCSMVSRCAENYPLQALLFQG